MSETPADERLPVWEALSDLFLDAELHAGDHQRMAEKLAPSKYTIEELEDILHYEVYPACHGNLLDVAGAWTGFRPDWIMEHVAPLKDNRPQFRVPPLHGWMFSEHWTAVSKLIQGKRRENG